MTTQPKYTRLRTVIIATTLCFAIIPMLLVGGIIPFLFTDLYHKKTLHEIESIARSKGHSIDIFFEERIGQLKSIADMYSYEELVAPSKLSELLRIMKSNAQSYVDFGVIDMEGNHVAYAGAYDISAANYKNEVWFNEVRRKGVYVSDVFLGFRNFPHIIIAVMREQAGKAWILRATVDSAVFNSIVQGNHSGNDGDAFVVNRTGSLQTSAPADTKPAQLTQLLQPWMGNTFTISKEHIGQQSMLLAKMPLTQVPWVLMIMKNPQEHVTLLFKTHILAALVIVLGLFALCAGTWLTTRTIINSLVSADKEKAAYDASLLQSSKMAALGKLAAGVAHEINNPLMLIREHAGWIKDLLEDEKPEKMEHHGDLVTTAGKIEGHVDRARNITHRLLGFARRVDPSAESLPLNPIVDQAMAFLQSEAGHRGITFERNFSKETLRVSTDMGQLQQVILNIIDNAIDAVDKGGKVTVSTNSHNSMAEIRIADTGPGIPPDRLQLIFDPFFTTKKTGEGTGLGLSICYSIMEGLGGNISATNLPEGGAEFTVRLPLSSDAA